MKRISENNVAYHAVIGIDWADRSHAVCLWDAATNEIEQSVLPGTPQDVEAWLNEIYTRYNGPVAISVEQARGALINQLAECSHLAIYVINPATLARFRQAFAPSMQKSDPSDARLLMELVRTHEHKLRVRQPLDSLSQQLASLTEARRSLVGLRVGLSNRLKQTLKDTFPQALGMLSDELFTQVATDFLKRWPSLADLLKSKPDTIRRFYYGHCVRRKELVDQRIASLREAVPVCTDEAVLGPARILITALCRQLAAVQASIQEYDRKIAEVFNRHPDSHIYRSLPGAGESLAPRLAAAFGQDRSRLRDAAAVQRASGIAPVTVSSGKMSRTCRRISKSRFLHQTFFEFASKSLLYCPWAKAYFDAQRAAGKTYGCAVRALAFKWIRIVHACWKEHQPYDDGIYSRQLSLRGSPHAPAA